MDQHLTQNGVKRALNMADLGFYYAVVDALLQVSFTEDEIGEVGGCNFCRVFDAATTGHR